MTPDFWHQAEQLFHAALQRAPTERAAFLAGACAGDRALQEHVERLLAQDDLADREGFLAPPELGDVSTPSPQADVTLLGRRLGPYEVRAEIGRGGMGTVYRAERVADYRQQVAVKVIKAGLADEHAPRFHRERQVLAELEHPHIARLLDGGTADGLPYLVMECIAWSASTAGRCTATARSSG